MPEKISITNYTPEQILEAYLNWVNCDRNYFIKDEQFIQARERLWHDYCDKRDSLPLGSSKNGYRWVGKKLIVTRKLQILAGEGLYA